MMERKLKRLLFLGFIRIHIMYHCAIEAQYGVALAIELQRHGYDVSYGTLYPILHQLESQGLLFSTKKNVAGKIRRYYSATNRGKEALQEAKQYIAELVTEVMDTDQNVNT